VVQPQDFERFDFILAMDRMNLADLQKLKPPSASARLSLFLEFAPQAESPEVPDPYHGGTEDFERVLDLCEAAARGLLLRLGK
jgi:protein-tyrosine phosphatase